MQPAEKLSVTLPSDVVRMIRAKVAMGSYSSPSEVVCTALHDWMRREQRLSVLDDAIAQGVADSDAGRVQEIETVREELRAQFSL